MATIGRNNILGSIPQDRGRYYDGDDIDLLMEENLDSQLEELEEEAQQVEAKPKCSRCNDNGCPACDGTKGSKYNPEPF